MPATYNPIATQTLSSNAADVTFSSIPGSYTDLVIITAVKYTSSEQALGLSFNGDTGTNYSATYLYGNGSSAASGRDTNNAFIPVARGDDFNFWTGITNVANYSNTTTYKSIVSRGNSGSYVVAYTGLWRNTAAITSIRIAQLTGSNFASGSTFTLYGIKAA